MKSLDTVAARRQGFANGLPQLRLASVTALIALQSVLVTDPGRLSQSRLLWLVPAVAYGILFGLTGYFMAKSRANHSPRDFIFLRVRRSLPAYAFAIVVTIIGVGIAATRLPFEDYLLQPSTGRYLLNLVALPQFRLADLFEFNILPTDVNSNVIVAPLYAICTILLAAVPVPGSSRMRGLAGFAVLVGLAGLFWFAGASPPDGIFDFSPIFQGDGASVLAGTFTGVLAYLLRRQIPLSWPTAILVLAVGVSVGWIAGAQQHDIAPVRGSIAIGAALFAIVVAHSDLPFGNVSRAFGPYLLGWLMLSFPFQQLASQYFGMNSTLGENLAWGAGPALVAAIAFHHLIGAGLSGPADGPTLVSLSRLTLASARGSGEEIRRGFVQGSLMLLLAVSLTIVMLGLMAMLYVAMQPERGGM